MATKSDFYPEASAPPAYGSEDYLQQSAYPSAYNPGFSSGSSSGRTYSDLGGRDSQSPVGRKGAQLPECANTSVRVVASVALAVITAAAAALMLTYGLNRLDFAVSSVDAFVGGFMAYMGAVYGIVAIANACLACGQLVGTPCLDEDDQKNILATQATVSLLAPVVAIPYACKFALYAGCLHAIVNGGRRH